MFGGCLRNGIVEEKKSKWQEFLRCLSCLFSCTRQAGSGVRMSEPRAGEEREGHAPSGNEFFFLFLSIGLTCRFFKFNSLFKKYTYIGYLI
jgi:hypothetical protein